VEKVKKDIQLTEMELTEQQMVKTKGDLEKLIRRMEKDKEEMKKEHSEVNKLKEKLVHLTEHKEFLVAHPDQGKSQASRPAQDSSVDAVRDSVSNRDFHPPSPSEAKQSVTELALIGKSKPSSSLAENVEAEGADGADVAQVVQEMPDGI